ncbi:glycine zipper family protein [Primorskyibacter sp. 2E107]|uniref:glycine zipper family protein n=1 Tax=Primorskyibacter sp. 2E107 TaxID=3403458 RepID=UPI003AF6ABF8
MKTAAFVSAAGLVLMAACGNSGAKYTPILDGTPTPAYQADLAACQALARNQDQFDRETMGATVLGAGIGAAVGEAESGDALGGAAAGALAGGIAGTVDASERREAIIIECLRGRGHRVVG